jgi:hypothetical protein
MHRLLAVKSAARELEAAGLAIAARLGRLVSAQILQDLRRPRSLLLTGGRRNDCGYVVPEADKKVLLKEARLAGQRFVVWRQAIESQLRGSEPGLHVDGI